ncbi:MAG: helix-turn-helix domain-containing protein [Pelagimonas sp.]|uniref:helix-turn-helix domain-containing protein n=1 Tax=Pelagimonas sp. TaxID=2073170 RepID=UPI003D6B3424
MSPPSRAPHLVDVVSHGQAVYLEHHVPVIENDPYHTHPSIEINYLRGCEMTYSFSGHEITIPQERICLFWAAYPHRPIALSGAGEITNAYISLQQFLDFAVSSDLKNDILGGSILCAKTNSASDRALMDRLSHEINNADEKWQILHRLEVQTRLVRLDTEGWDIIGQPRPRIGRHQIGGGAVAHFDKMLRFIALNAFEPISVLDVANSAGISTNYAITLFRKMLGMTVKAYITDLRIHHAKMMLTETSAKILTVSLDCGFASLSSFYDAFANATGMSPSQFRKNGATPSSDQEFTEKFAAPFR